MVLACESIFSRTSLDARPRNLHTFSKVNLKYTKRTFPVGQARCSFHLPHSFNLLILLARGSGASTNVEPCKGQLTSFSSMETGRPRRSTVLVGVSVIHFSPPLSMGGLLCPPPSWSIMWLLLLLRWPWLPLSWLLLLLLLLPRLLQSSKSSGV